MGFSKQEYWSGLPFPPPGESSHPRDQTHVSCVSCTSSWVPYHWEVPPKMFISKMSLLVNDSEESICVYTHLLRAFSGGSVSKESACSAGDPGSISGLETSPGGGNGNPLLYSCLERPVDRGAWRATVHGVAESDTTEQRTLSLYFITAYCMK